MKWSEIEQCDNELSKRQRAGSSEESVSYTLRNALLQLKSECTDFLAKDLGRMFAQQRIRGDKKRIISLRKIVNYKNAEENAEIYQIPDEIMLAFLQGYYDEIVQGAPCRGSWSFNYHPRTSPPSPPPPPPHPLSSPPVSPPPFSLPVFLSSLESYPLSPPPPLSPRLSSSPLAFLPASPPPPPPSPPPHPLSSPPVSPSLFFPPQDFFPSSVQSPPLLSSSPPPQPSPLVFVPSQPPLPSPLSEQTGDRKELTWVEEHPESDQPPTKMRKRRPIAAGASSARSDRKARRASGLVPVVLQIRAYFNGQTFFLPPNLPLPLQFLLDSEGRGPGPSRRRGRR